MKVYLIDYEIGRSVGNYPQVNEVRPGYDEEKPNSYRKLTFSKMPDFIPDLDYFILHRKAKITDFISIMRISADGYLISEKVKSIFSHFKLPDHRFFPARLKHLDTFYSNYYWFHISTEQENEIDYSNSKFDEYNFHEGTRRLVENSIHSLEDLWAYHNSLRGTPLSVGMIKCRFKEKSSYDYGIYLLPFCGEVRCFFSENLVQALKQNQVTGFEIKERFDFIEDIDAPNS